MQVVTGFIGSTQKNNTTTIGRNGSDYTASIFGAALNVKQIEIWTDVSGVYSANPKIVKNANVIPFLNFEEAMEYAEILSLNSNEELLHIIKEYIEKKV